jgi:predicted molibdopterin-dependent oxidoreductase YjgC
VVLPAAEAHERPGTTTNIEGRVSRVAQKLVPPGQAWPDWMIASELAHYMGSDMGIDSMAAVWAEIERLAPAYAGITADVLDAPWARDGVVAPFAGAPVSQAAVPLDPIAVPGVESVERQGAPPRAGSAVTPTAGPDGQVTVEQGTGGQGEGRPPVLAGPAGINAPHVAPTDSYSFRLVVGRTLYDGGTAVAMSEALTPLVTSAPLRVNPHDLDDLGITTGDLVRVRTARDSVVVPVAADPGLARKVVATELNVPFGEVTAGDLIDATSPVVELRLETP